MQNQKFEDTLTDDQKQVLKFNLIYIKSNLAEGMEMEEAILKSFKQAHDCLVKIQKSPEAKQLIFDRIWNEHNKK